MKERPIIMSAPMVRAILAGQKTQTRRIAKFEQSEASLPFNKGTSWQEYKEGFVVQGKIGSCWNDLTEPLKCPYGQPGDRLWVRETWQEVDWSRQEFAPDKIYNCSRNARGHPSIQYAADYPEKGKGWKPSIHMPRWSSRILLEVVSVRVERLQDISRGDCMAEGCPFPNIAKETDPVGWYRQLWEDLNGPGSWDANPWVWVIEFKRVEA